MLSASVLVEIGVGVGASIWSVLRNILRIVAVVGADCHCRHYYQFEECQEKRRFDRLHDDPSNFREPLER